MMIPTATVHDWKKLPSGLDCTGSINVALEKLASFLSAFNLIPKGSKVSGLARCDFKVLPDKEAQAVVMDLALSKLAFTSRTGKVFQEQAGRLGVDASITMAEGNLVLNSLQIDTSPLNLKCSGTLTDLKKKRDLALKGRLEPDFARIAEIITVITGKHWDIEGKRPEDFFIRTSLSEKTWSAILQKTDALADLYVKRLKAFGVEGSDIMTKLVVKDSQAQANLETKVNEGDLKIVPVVDLRGKRPVLEVADNSRILNQVNLTDEMASELLALIHPIFKGSAIAGGRVGMLLKHCRVPLDETMKKGTDISGEVNLKGVELMPSGLLKAILGIAKIESARATISDQTISFLCRDGRIESSPLTLKAEGHQIILSGYMTLEGMVNYAAEVPVTEKMVSQDIYKYVKDARLKLLIEGPVSKPRISRKSMDETLESLVKEAAKNLIMEKGTDLFKQLLKKH
jgi:hypothetical protein